MPSGDAIDFVQVKDGNRLRIEILPTGSIKLTLTSKTGNLIDSQEFKKRSTANQMAQWIIVREDW